MLNTIIIDDEKDARDTLRNFIEEYCSSQLTIIEEANSVASGLTAIQSLSPDLVFLDIQMNDGTGFDLLDQLSNYNFSLIFTTAFDRFAVQAFRYSAIDYLLKPINPDELIEAVEKTSYLNQNQQLEEKLNLLIDSYQTKNLKRISFPTKDGLTIVNVTDIIRCKADNNYTHVFLTNGKHLVASKTLKEYETIFPEDQFCRVHQSHIINLNYIEKYIRGEGGTVIMTDNTEIEVSRRKKQSLLNKIS